MKKLTRRNIVVVAVVLAILAFIYVELAVGLVGSPWAGS